jgi:hypothetical protein
MLPAVDAGQPSSTRKSFGLSTPAGCTRREGGWQMGYLFEGKLNPDGPAGKGRRDDWTHTFGCI